MKTPHGKFAQVTICLISGEQVSLVKTKKKYQDIDEFVNILQNEINSVKNNGEAN